MAAIAADRRGVEKVEVVDRRRAGIGEQAAIVVFAVDGAVVAVNRQRAAGAERNDRQVGGQVDADGCVRGAKLDNVIAGATGDRGDRGPELLFRRLRPPSADVSTGALLPP